MSSDAIVGQLISRWLEDEAFELMDASELPDLLVRNGLAVVVPYDPAEHTASDYIEPGDDYYLLTVAGRTAREAYHNRLNTRAAKDTPHA